MNFTRTCNALLVIQILNLLTGSNMALDKMLQIKYIIYQSYRYFIFVVMDKCMMMLSKKTFLIKSEKSRADFILSAFVLFLSYLYRIVYSVKPTTA